ncbi:methyltransferase regulatory domain-containing protein [Pseudomonas sp. CGJS7]|uniref:methyltransferase regulatory domain-containing protein n=1 Tax=Pseudomonas sp. CGJS7 TaxID=3109348 RepID=UPI00300BA0AB
MSELQLKIGSSYDQLPYRSAAFALTAPEHLQAVASLFGVKAPDPRHARVLELGCAAGGNLLPFAAANPRARAVGVDLSQVQIGHGRELAAELGLDNIDLRCMSIADIDRDLGSFDYIVCHGVYSWVPAEVQDAILRVCKRHLNQDGIAYVSYNTYPGWKAKEVIRDAMILRGGERGSAQERLAYARGMIEFMHRHARAGSVLKQSLDENIDMVLRGDESYLHHEFLELCNAPCYFRDFLARAQPHGLAYLAEAGISGMFASSYGEEIAAPLLRECTDQPGLEQMLDFLRNRTFRQTLLMHGGRQVRYAIDDARLMDLHIAGEFVAESGAGEGSYRAECSQQTFTVHNRVGHETVRRLNQAWPSTVPVRSLAAVVAAETGASAQQVLAMIDFLLTRGAVRFRLTPLDIPLPGERPRVPAPIRALARRNAQAPTQVGLFNRWHDHVVPAGPVDSLVLELADGILTRAQLVRAVRERNRDGAIRFFAEGKELQEGDTRDRAAADHVVAALQRLRRQALLG